MSYKKPINLTFIYTAVFTVILVLLIAGLSFWSMQKHKEEQTTELLATSRAIAKHLISNVAYKNKAVVLPFHTEAGTKIEFKINNLSETSTTDSMDKNYTYKIISKNNSRVFHYEQTILKSEATAPLLLSIDIPMSVSDRVHNKRIRRDIISFVTIGLLSIIFISFAFWRLSKRVSHNLYREMEEDRLRALIELAGATAHELRQPLSIIVGFTDLINDKLKNNEDIEHDFIIIKQQCLRMDDIIKKMLNITSYKTVEYVGGIRIFDLHSQKTPSETFPASWKN